MAAEVDSVDVVTGNKSGGSGKLSSRKGGQSTGRYSNTKNFIAGGVGGVVVVALGHPFDTIKVRPAVPSDIYADSPLSAYIIASRHMYLEYVWCCYVECCY